MVNRSANTGEQFDSLDILLERPTPELLEMLDDNLSDLITEFPLHSFEKIERGIAPLSRDRSYVCLLNDKWVIVGQFTGSSPVADVMNIF
jgi:hypothetical protein